MADESLTSSAKQSFLEVPDTCIRRPQEDSVPYKKKRTKLVDLFNRASIATANPDDCTKVYLRVKPFTGDEDSSQKCLRVIPEENAVQATAPDSSHAHKSSTKGVGKSSLKFTFSQIFDENTKQPEFFNATMLELTKEFIGGQNSLVFSYGVTSSGKTYTIQGKPQDAGILPRSLDVLFNSINGKQLSDPSLKPEMFNDFVRLSACEVLEQKKIKKQTLKLGANDDPTVMSLMGEESVLSDTAMSSSSGVEDLLADVVNRDREKMKVDVDENMRFGVWVSFAEVYNEQVYDLLVPVPQKKKAKRQTLRISDDRNGNPYIKGLKEIHVESADEAYKLLTIGQRNLMTACTRLNHCSSRSHSIFNIKILRVVDKDNPHIACVSMLSLCDLAGAERYSKTQASGDRLREAGNINTSLMTLGRCIETLRHNQLHRDQQRLVPFRDSKLTRILQNFYTGCGKAAMIVNVSQAAFMFDDTLHVFKFSAIAKQVKYEKPLEEKKVQRIKKLPPLQRQTLVWESQDTLKEAQNTPLPTDEDDDLIEDNDEELSDIESLRKYIETLEERNKSLYEMLADEVMNAKIIESRIRKEAYEAMQKQMVIIEENYSSMLKDASMDAEELADERARGIMEVYEKRLKRIQTKMDEEDEWVSSMLYYQEKTKVEEKQAKIEELEKQLQQKKSIDDSVDMGNSVLVETLTDKLQKATKEIASKEAEVTELKLLVEEAGETYTSQLKEITALNESLAKEKKTIQQMAHQIANFEKLLCEAKKDAAKSCEALDIKEKEWLASEQLLLNQLKSKDSAVTSLEEECRELQEEIERLQDQMSQIDEQSRCQQDLDSSSISNKSQKIKQSLSILENPCNGDPKLKLGKENICDVPGDKQKMSQLVDDLTNTKNDLENKQKEIGTLRVQYVNLESTHKSTLKEVESVRKELDGCKESLEKTKQELGETKGISETTSQNLNDAKDQLIKVENSLKLMHEKNEALIKENKSLDTALADALKELKEAEEKHTASLHLRHDKGGPTEITHMVKVIEEKMSPHKTPGKNFNEREEDDDEEIVFNIKTALAKDSCPLKQTESKQPEEETADLVLKLKDAELANIALRSKLKHEEDDYFKREQALIHGYTAEIDSLKHELTKFKAKVEGAPTARPQRGKKRTHMDISTCSSVSESYCEGMEDKQGCHPRLNSVTENPDNVHDVNILSNEITLLQEQLVSLTAAYRLSVKKDERDENISVKKELEPASKAARLSEVSPRHRYSLTNSMLLFEKEEYALKFEEMSCRVVQLEDEIRNLTEQLEKQIEKVEKNENDQSKAVENRGELETELSESSKKVCTLTKEVDNLREGNYKIQETLELAVTAKDHLEIKLKEQEEIVVQLEEAKNVLDMDLKKTTELNNQRCQDLNSEIESLTQKLAEIVSEKDLLERDLQTSQNKLTSSSTQIETTMHEQSVLQDKLKETANLLEEYQSKLILAEQNSVKTKQELEAKDSHSKLLDERCKNLEKCLLEKEKSLKQNEEDYHQQLHSVREQLNSDCNTKSSALSTMQEEMLKISSQLKEKSEKLAQVERLRQEEAAEVAQKLITLERHKKTLERRAIEASNKEEEIKIKLQGYETLKEDIQKLQQDLQTANLKVQEEETLNAQLQKEIALITEEVNQLRKRDIALTSAEESDSLKAKVKELEKTLDTNSKVKDQALREKAQLFEKIEELRVELLESEKTMDQQEEVLTKQDEEIKELKSELDSSKTEWGNLDKALTRKDLELANLNKQIRKYEDEVSALRLSERRWQDAEERDKTIHEKLLKSSSTNGALQTKVETLQNENSSLKKTFEEKEDELKEEKEKLKKIIAKTDLQLKEMESENKGLAGKIRSLNEELASAKSEKKKVEIRAQDVEVELEHLQNKVSKVSAETKSMHDMMAQNTHLQEEAEKAKLEMKKVQQERRDLESRLHEITEAKKVIEKDLQRQESINKRNKEEMENWKAERDSCVKQLEQCMKKLTQEKEHLTDEVEKLKKSNADLAQEAHNIGQRKDALISELKKSNNTMSIQLADAEGMTPPPKMDTPESAFPGQLAFEEDINTSGHLELDVTPMAAKRGKKRHTSLRSLISSSVDPEATPEPKCLKTIKEEMESPMSPSGKSPRMRVAELANEVIATLSPLTRSSAKKLSTRNKGKKTATQAPFETATYEAPTEESSSMSTRRSSRLRKTISKHSIV